MSEREREISDERVQEILEWWQDVPLATVQLHPYGIIASLVAHRRDLLAQLTTEREARERARLLAETWRYQSGACPACRQSPHTADCFVVALLDILR